MTSVSLHRDLATHQLRASVSSAYTHTHTESCISPNRPFQPPVKSHKRLSQWLTVHCTDVHTNMTRFTWPEKAGEVSGDSLFADERSGVDVISVSKTGESSGSGKTLQEHVYVCGFSRVTAPPAAHRWDSHCTSTKLGHQEKYNHAVWEHRTSEQLLKERRKHPHQPWGHALSVQSNSFCLSLTLESRKKWDKPSHAVQLKNMT